MGTVHGLTGRKPHIELEDTEIREQVSVPLGTARSVRGAVPSYKGGHFIGRRWSEQDQRITDLETAFLSALGLDSSITNETVLKLPSEQLDKAHEAVTRVVEEKCGIPFEQPQGMKTERSRNGFKQKAGCRCDPGEADGIRRTMINTG